MFCISEYWNKREIFKLYILEKFRTMYWLVIRQYTASFWVFLCGNIMHEWILCLWHIRLHVEHMSISRQKKILEPFLSTFFMISSLFFRLFVTEIRKKKEDIDNVKEREKEQEREHMCVFKRKGREEIFSCFFR